MNSRANRCEEDPLWYKDAIIYQLHVKAFFDSNNDGIGDFRGLTQKLDYIRDLGVNTVWLLPFYPSPMRDDGYDIADYRNIHSSYGTRQDFRYFMREAHRRCLRVITELVINHTSDQHPWFQAARMAPRGSAKRNYYVWSDSDKKFPETRIIFTDTEKSNWAWDQVAQQYYWHRFFSHQPDLNHNNQQVVKAVIRVMRFWLDMGVDGMRLDAIPYLCVHEGTNNENLPETHAVLKQMRATVDAHYRGRMFLAEANQWPEDVRDYFGQGDECHMAYHFPLMPRMYMALAQEDRHPIVEIMQQTPAIPDICQWAIFLRNHDELTLEMVTNRERDYMYRIYAADPRMRLNAGIRRRLAPLLDNDPDQIKLMNSLLLSMPGSPTIYYGDEIGMGDNFFLGDRNGVRTPMQWSPDRNAGFSRADPQSVYLPPIMDAIYGYEAVNVESQSRNPASLLNWTKRVLAVRKAHPAFGRGSLTFLEPGNRKILAYVREYGEEFIFCVANLSRSAQPVELDLGRFKGRVPVELLGRTAFPPIGELPYFLTLPGHGFYWFSLGTEAEAPSWHKEMLPPPELPVVVLFDVWRSFFPEQAAPQRTSMATRLRDQLEQDVLPRFLREQRWFAAKSERLQRVEVMEVAAWPGKGEGWLWSWVKVHIASEITQTYTLPLAIGWGESDDERLRLVMPNALAKVRQHGQVGVIYDALADEEFCRALLQGMAERLDLPCGHGTLRFRATDAYSRIVGEGPPHGLQQPQAGSNTAIILGERLFLKIYRQLRPGINPEVEMGRFLTEVSPFPHISPLVGAIEYHSDRDDTSAIAVAQAYVPNQGDCWSYSIGYLNRFFEDCLTNPQEIAENRAALHGDYMLMMRTLGQRTGELHAALAKPSGDPAFDPESITTEDLRAWKEKILNEALAMNAELEARRADIAKKDRAAVDQVLQAKASLLARIADRTPVNVDAVKTRHHGDYHLGQVLLRDNDFVIIDFEGEPDRPLSERRTKHSPLLDVASMLRSFSYAGASAIADCTVERPEDRDLLSPYLRDWEAAAREAFLIGYQEGVADCLCWPRDPDQAEKLIDLFVLEKALYEVHYELGHRVEWVGIPLAGLLGILYRSALPRSNEGVTK